MVSFEGPHPFQPVYKLKANKIQTDIQDKSLHGTPSITGSKMEGFAMMEKSGRSTGRQQQTVLNGAPNHV